MSERRDDDETVATAFAEASRAREPSRFETARAARELEAALDAREQRQRRGWRTQVVASAVLLAAVGGVAGGLALSARAPEAPNGGAVAVAVSPSVVAPPAFPLPAPLAPAVSPAVSAPAAPELALAAASPAALPPSALAPVRRGEAGWRAQAELLAAAGNERAAARVLAAALLTDDAAAAPLMASLRRAPAALDEVDAALAPSKRAEPMRLRCEARLLFRRDRSALDACRAFAQRFPEHPGARVLSFAAGRVAEDELGDLEAAEGEYGRALLLSPLAGLPSTDALLARARVRAARGVLDEARADLRLYLHQEPAARGEPAVQALMVRLGVEP